MNRNIFRLIFLFAILPGTLPLYCIIPRLSGYRYADTSPQDTLRDNQVLYNGKMWRNLYSMVKGDQFFFSREYLQGSLTINGSSYKNILINYDIYNDEILTANNHGSIIQLNKEMVDSFLMVYAGKTYRFVNVREDSLSVLKGYVKVLYQEKSALYVKYKKEIQALAIEDKYDMFYRLYRIYFVKDGKVYQISSKSDLLKVLQEDKARIKDFMKKNRLKVSKTEPESFIPVIRYYDSLIR
jgi:hypothetical protein